MAHIFELMHSGQKVIFKGKDWNEIRRCSSGGKGRLFAHTAYESQRIMRAPPPKVIDILLKLQKENAAVISASLRHSTVSGSTKDLKFFES